MSYVSSVVKQNFKERYNKCLEAIKNSEIDYDSVGIVGSYAREEYTARSDIDFCIVMKEKPERWKMGALREDLDLLNADVVFVTPQYFKEDTSLFAEQLRRDFKEVVI